MSWPLRCLCREPQGGPQYVPNSLGWAPRVIRIESGTSVMRDLDKALEDYDQAIKLEPDVADA